MSWQRYDTPWTNLAHFRAGFTFGALHVFPFRFQCPGPRVMLTVKFIVRQVIDSDSTKVPGPSSLPPTVNGIFDWTEGSGVQWKLWLAKTVKAENGTRIPVENLLGTRAVPAQLSDQNVAQNGFTFDVQVGGDGIDGEITADATVGGFEPDPGWELAIKGRYNAIAKICDEEWAELAAAWPGSPTGSEQVLTF